MDRRKFINTSAITGAGLFAGPILKKQNSDNSNTGNKSSSFQNKKTILFPAKEIPVVLETDVVIIGSGPAVFGAAMRAARSGINVALI